MGARDMIWRKKRRRTAEVKSLVRHNGTLANEERMCLGANITEAA